MNSDIVIFFKIKIYAAINNNQWAKIQRVTFNKFWQRIFDCIKYYTMYVKVAIHGVLETLNGDFFTPILERID